MAVKKLSVALDDEVAAAAKHAASLAGGSLSAWLNRAAENELAIEEGLEAVRAWEADHGDLSDEELAQADGVLDRILAGAQKRAR